jgi:hypothetical protein
VPKAVYKKLQKQLLFNYLKNWDFPPAYENLLRGVELRCFGQLQIHLQQVLTV